MRITSQPSNSYLLILSYTAGHASPPSYHVDGTIETYWRDLNLVRTVRWPLLQFGCLVVSGKYLVTLVSMILII